MARETKVGLIAGLAFIICFAIVLSNRGDYVSRQTAWPQHPTPGGRGPGVAAADAFVPVDPAERRRRRGYGLDARLSDIGRPNGGTPAEIDTRSPDVRSTGPTSGADVLSTHSLEGGPVLLAQSSGRTERPASAAATNTLDRRVEAVPPVKVGGGSDATPPTLGWNPSPGQLEERLRDVAARAGSNRGAHGGSLSAPSSSRRTGEAMHLPPAGMAESPKVAGETSVGNGAIALRRYRVKPGDTLYGIATDHYGKPAAAIVKAIFDANRSVLSDPDTLPAGAELVLPAVAGLEQPPPSRSPVPESRLNQRPAGFRWYQIRKNDRYVTIARDQLGDESRWREIFEMNKDKFPDPQFIREGVRIKIPADSPTDSQGKHP